MDGFLNFSPETIPILWLCGAAFLAGLIDAVVGGGGLVQLPALFIFLPPSMVPSLPALLGTNKFSSIWGTATAAIQYQRRVRIPWRSVLPAALVALAASFLGARAAVHLNPQLLRPLIFFLLVAVAIYTYWKKDLGALHAPDFQPAFEPWLMATVGLVIGFYDGFFRPGTGSFLIFIFIGLFGFDFLTSSASAKVINFATNLSAVIYFAWTDHILYRVGIPMAVCNVLGALTGARLAILKGNQFVRTFFLIVVSALMARFGAQLLGW